MQIAGKTWPTSEHYFQGQKFAGTEHEEAIRRQESPTIAARIGRDRNRPLRPDWEQVKDDIMREAVREVHAARGAARYPAWNRRRGPCRAYGAGRVLGRRRRRIRPQHAWPDPDGDTRRAASPGV